MTDRGRSCESQLDISRQPSTCPHCACMLPAMNMRIALVLTLLLVASAFSGQAAAQGGAEQLAFTWCYVDYGYSEGALVCRIVAVNPDAANRFNPDGSPANWLSLSEGAGPAWSPDGT